MLFMLAKTCFLLKIIHIRLMAHVQRRSNFLFIYPVCLSVYTSFNSPKYSLNVFKFMCGIQVYCGMFRIENDVCKIDSSCTETHKRIKRHYLISQCLIVKLLKEPFIIFILQ